MQFIRDLIQGPLPKNGENLTVETTLSPTGWNPLSIPFDLSQHLLYCIRNALAHTNANKDNIMYWRKTSNSKFTTSSAYKSIIGVETNQPSNYTWTWKMPTPNKIKTFMWLLCYGKLPTKHCLHRLGVATNSNCPLCDHSTKNINHIFLCCPNASSAWNNILVHNPNPHHFNWSYSTLNQAIMEWKQAKK